MDLFLLRHGVAEERTTAKSDRERSLTHEGKERIHRVAGAIKILGYTFDAIVSSPLVRARQTASILAHDLGTGGGPDLSELLAPDGDPRQLMRTLSEKYSTSRSLLLVGHEPDLSHLAALLLTRDGTAMIRFKKGGICKIKLDALGPGRHGTLEWLLAPAQMLKIR